MPQSDGPVGASAGPTCARAGAPGAASAGGGGAVSAGGGVVAADGSVLAGWPAAGGGESWATAVADAKIPSTPITAVSMRMNRLLRWVDTKEHQEAARTQGNSYARPVQFRTHHADRRQQSRHVS